MSRVTAPRTRIHPLSPDLWRIYLAFLVPTLAILAALTFLLYRFDLNVEHSIHRERGRHIVALHSEIISREMDTVRSDLHYLRQQATLLDFLGDPTPSALERLCEEYVLFSGRRGLYDQIRYLDESGYEIVRVNYCDGQPMAVPTEDLQTKDSRYYFQDTMALSPGETYVSPMDLNVEHDQVELPLKPVIRFATPVRNRQGARRGIVVLNYLGTHVLQMLDETDSGVYGPVMLLDAQGGYIRGPSDGESLLLLERQRSFAEERHEAWTRIAAVTGGEHLDESGLYTHRRVPLGAQNTDPALLVVRHIHRSTLHQRPQEFLGRLLFLEALVVLLVAAPSWFLARSGAMKREFQRRLVESEERLRALSVQLLSTQEDERRKISRDLHDDLGQIVTATTLALERALGQKEPKKREELIERALEGTRSVLRRVHEMSSRLRPPLLDDLGLGDAVRSYLSEYESRHPISVRLHIRLQPDDEISLTIQENIYRILQEALTNVAKYAQVEVVKVEIEADRDSIGLRVEDEGNGFRIDDVDPTSLGLLGMRERAELLDGSFELSTGPGEGTRVQVNIPLRTARRSGRSSSRKHSSPQR